VVLPIEMCLCGPLYRYVCLCGQSVGMLVAEEESEASKWKVVRKWCVEKNVSAGGLLGSVSLIDPLQSLTTLIQAKATWYVGGLFLPAEFKSRLKSYLFFSSILLTVPSTSASEVTA